MNYMDSMEQSSVWARFLIMNGLVSSNSSVMELARQMKNRGFSVPLLKPYKGQNAGD